ncbi:MAG TPA: ATP-binding protein [Oxalicibacterium sp.]|nr:ATP-binding protein [Oxalicibacterium sp.]
MISYDKFSASQRYVAGFSIACAAAAVQWALWLSLGSRIPFLVFVSSLAMCAILLGPGPAGVVLMVGFVSGLLMLEPIHSFHVEESGDQLALTAYVALGLMFLFAGSKLRRYARVAEDARTEVAAASMRAEHAVQRQEKRFLVAIEASAVPFSLLDPVRDANGAIVDFRWSYLNRAAAATLGFERDSLIGRKINDVLPGSWDEPGMLERYCSVSATGESQQFEFYSSANGIKGWYHVYASALDDSIVVWFQDITEQKQGEQSLQEEAKSKDRFIATLAHELRNPLAPIQQATSLMRQPGASDHTRQWAAEVIDRQSRHMAVLLNDLLDMSRISRGVLTLRKALVEVKPAIHDAIEAADPLIRTKQHELIVRMPPHDVYLEADQVRVTQILSNLLTNAAKYTDSGGTILLAVEAEDDTVSICVSDTGIGIKAEKLQEIFEMFTQVRPERDNQDGGLGIGLAVTKGLVELHGGTIEAASDGPGAGSRFTVRLPAAQQHVPAAVDAGAREHKQAPGALRVLIADDNHDAADVLASLMELQGNEVHVAYEGQAALAAYHAFRPHVAFLDIGMPLLTGVQVAEAIRAAAGGGNVTLVAVTGWGQDNDRANTLRAGFNHHLTKPVSFDRMEEILQEVRQQAEVV